MRITIRLDCQSLRDAKAFAAETGQTLQAVINDALREMLARRSGVHQRQRVVLTTVGGSGTYPGVEPDDSAALWDRLDSRE